MIQTPQLDSPNPPTEVGEIFGTPVVVVGNTWLPLTQLVAWGILTRLGIKSHPERPFGETIYISGQKMVVILGSEWCHNLAHALTAKWVGQPMDALRVAWGMPLCVYYDIDDPNVTPRQHIARAMGGPVINSLLLGIFWLLRKFLPENSIAREITHAGIDTNLFLFTVSLLPIPGIDGGPILKWGLVERGHTQEEADEIVVQVNKVAAVGLGVAAGVAIKQKRKFIGVIIGMLSAIALGVGFGLLKEKK